MEFELPPVLASAPGVRAAELVLDGLSVCYFNSTEQFWEVVYPHETEHELRITIHRLNAAREEVEPPVYDITVPSNVTSFDISLTNGSQAHYASFPEGGPSDPNFSRTAPGAPENNPHDLGWMIDIAGPELDHGNVDLRPGPASRPISLARIHHSLFCTLRPEAEEVRISPIDTNHPYGAGSRSLPFNNTEIVGVLLGDSSSGNNIQFQFDPVGSINIDPLEYSETQRYRIRIINEDPDGTQHYERPFVRGDLRLFYGLVIDVDGVKKDLWAHSRPGQVVPDGNCHPDRYRGGTLRSLIQGE